MTQTISAVTTIIAPTISSSGTTTTTSTGHGPATTRIVIDRKVANRSETFATMRKKVVERLGGGNRMAAGPRCWSTVPLLSAAVFLLLLSSFGEHPFAKASTIHRHTADDNDTSMQQQQTKDHQQANGKYSNSNENFSPPTAGGAQALAPASLQAASPQTMTLTADKNKTKLLKCHCDICKDENYVCETDGVCFTSVTKEADGKHKYSYSTSPPLISCRFSLPSLSFSSPRLPPCIDEADKLFRVTSNGFSGFVLLPFLVFDLMLHPSSKNILHMPLLLL